jgi:type I restriction enzyme R subunit
VADKVRTLCPSLVELRRRWSDADLRAEIIAKLEERGIDFDELRAATSEPDADPFDLLCYVAFSAPIRSRRERADQLRKDKKDFFECYSPEARAVLNEFFWRSFILPEARRVRSDPCCGF